MRILAGLAVCASLIAALAAASTAAAATLIELSVHDRKAGKALPVYESTDGRFVAGSPGREYSLRLRNRSGGDVLAVVSVDGVNVLSGETASPDQGGYVIPAYGSVEIKGWRKSLERVAAFYFTDLGDSYAARTGRPDDVGVIGVAVFERKPPEISLDHTRRFSRERAPAPAAASGAADAAAEPEAKLGTGHGRSEASSARVVSFERATTTPTQSIALRYDSRRNLLAMGVISHPRRPDPFPNAFPGGFVPDPQ